MKLKRLLGAILAMLIICSLASSMSILAQEEEVAGYSCYPPKSCPHFPGDGRYGLAIDIEDCCCDFYNPEILVCW